MRIELSEAALRDIQNIRCYTLRQWGSLQEEKYLNSVWAEFQKISVNPENFRQRNDLFPECRIAPVGSHIILFRVQMGLVQIARVLHRAMDFNRHIPEDLRQP